MPDPQNGFKTQNTHNIFIKREYLQCLFAYDIMPVGKNENVSTGTQQIKSPERHLWGFFRLIVTVISI